MSCAIEVYFDLDEALTLPANSSAHGREYKALLAVADMPVATPVAGEVCTVCLVAFRPAGIGGVAKQVPCGHVYHDACISSWLSHSNSCPLCRCNISAAHT